MPAPGIDWTSAILMLTAGIVIGAVIIYIAVRSKGAPATQDFEGTMERRDLEAKGDALIQQLRELEDTAGKIDPHELARQRYESELEAAKVWMQFDAVTKKSGTRTTVSRETVAPGTVIEEAALPAPAPTGFLATSPALRGFLWGVGSIAVLAGLFYFVMSKSTPRAEGGSVTGGDMAASAGTAQAPRADDAEMQKARAVVEQDPSNVDARLELARLSLVREDLMEAFNQTETVLQQSPQNARALTYQAFVRMAMGQAQTALEMLKRATGYQPDLIDGWIQLALVYTQMGQDAEAADAMQHAIKLRPDQKQNLENLLAQMKASMAPGAQQAAAASQPQEAAPAGSDANSVVGTVEVDPAIQSLPAGATLYVMARPAGTAGGPPLAVQKLPAGSFPVGFSIGAANSMMGEALPGKVRLEARVDFDGNAMTREPTDPFAVLDPVAAGTKSVRLVLKRP